METFLFSGVFWGIIIILWGISIIVNAIFNVHIPIFRILLAVFFVYIGIMVLTGGFRFHGKTDQNTVLFSEGRMQLNASEKSGEYNVLFGKGTVPLSGIKLEKETTYIKVNAIFGECIVEIDSKMPVRIRASSAFGSVFLPDNNIISFGNSNYESPSFSKDKKFLEIEASAVFGALRVVNVGSPKKTGKDKK